MPVRDLPRPRNWEDFEDLTCDLYRAMWSPQTMRHGRAGQPQQGVDVYGQLPDGKYFGVQCKKKYRDPVSKEELEAELGKAKSFMPPLTRFVLATTAERDVKIQEHARMLSTDELSVSVAGWQDFCEELAGHSSLLRKHFADLYQDDPSDLKRHYLRHLFTELDDVPVTKRGSDGDSVALSSVYIDLDVEAQVFMGLKGEGRPRESGEGLWHVELKCEAAEVESIFVRAKAEAAERSDRQRDQPYSRRCTAIEAVATAPRRVLTGRGGSGKSTFGRFLCLCLAGEQMPGMPLDLSQVNRVEADEALRPWSHGALLPFFVELRRFVRHEAFPGADEKGRARHLTSYLATLGPTGDAGDMEKLVLHGLERGALVVLDGLDETPAAESVRERLKAVITSFAELYPSCRLLVTSRPYAYAQGQDWRLDDADFVEETLAPFDRPKIERFVTEAYSAFARRNRLEAEESQRLSRDLLTTLLAEATLRPLAEQPLMLTMMTDLHASRGGRLPGARSKLFEESVGLLFDRWNERRHLRSVAQIVGIEEEQIRSALELLAFRVHRDGGRAKEHACDVPEGELYKALTDTRKRYGSSLERFSPEEVRDHLNERSGILVAESPSLYRFPHRFFQEYLAACHLDHFGDKRKKCLESDPGLWREVMLFLAGRLEAGDQIWHLLAELVPVPPAETVEVSDPRFERALIAALALRENKLHLRDEEEHRPKLERVRLWLRRAVEIGALDVADRVQAGQVLGLLGDDRPGVGVRGGLPDIEWVEIPAGEFTMGSDRYGDEKPVHREHVDAFRISRYPVTNEQFELFFKGGGYTEEWRHCWTDEGWAWRKAEKRKGPEAYGSPFNLPNHPRVGVSWFEAVAFCRWLSEQLGEEVRLPTETEWERASRGVNGWEYPWGADFDASKCNNAEGGVGSTTAVGLYPGGESPTGREGFGILDASGNVWEWCLTKWRDSYEQSEDKEMEGKASRVVRGGSWIVDWFGARCASRGYVVPHLRDRNVGFRLLAPI